MKILVITASPNKTGNSNTMLEAFLAGVNKTHGIEVVRYDINEVPMRYYSHEVKRPPADEVKFIQLVENLKTCDGLVISTPTYNFSVPSNLKNFIDRISYAALNYEKLNIVRQPSGTLGHIKPFFIVSGGSPTWIQKPLFFIFPLTWLRIIFIYFGARFGGGIYGGSLSFTMPASKRPKLLARCKRAGVCYAKKIKKLSDKKVSYE